VIVNRSALWAQQAIWDCAHTARDGHRAAPGGAASQAAANRRFGVRRLLSLVAAPLRAR